MAGDQACWIESSEELQRLERFCRALEASPEQQRHLKACSSPEAILELAEEMATPVSRQVLRARSRDLAADYWPWAQQGTAWRRKFFGEPEV